MTTDLSNFDKRWSDARFRSFLFYYYCISYSVHLEVLSDFSHLFTFKFESRLASHSKSKYQIYLGLIEDICFLLSNDRTIEVPNFCSSFNYSQYCSGISTADHWLKDKQKVRISLARWYDLSCQMERRLYTSEYSSAVMYQIYHETSSYCLFLTVLTV